MPNDLGHIVSGAGIVTTAVATSLVLAAAASAAPIERSSVAPSRAARVAPMKLTSERSRYTIDLVDEAGNRLETYRARGRFYTLGDPGARYSVRIGNPTDRRIEAVVSIDGLDVIDGDDADFQRKRGYIIAPHDTLVVEGFRTSYSSVAAFRFSSVAASYAGRKGKARNVGVVGVAIFEEARPVAVTVPRGPYHLRDEDRARPRPVPPAEPTTGARDRSAGEGAGRVAPSSPGSVGSLEGGYDAEPAPERPGLGTEFGESRWSEVTFTQFVRRNPRRPDALGELRYNDRDGLLALGIRLPPDPPSYPDELYLRETADPFPASGFAQPPR
jgi:hypothetical protein